MESTGTDRRAITSFLGLLRNPLKFRLFLLKNLPAAFFSGLKIVEADETSCTVSIPYKWLTRNPFGSTYFASMSMAAEMSTGALVMGYSYGRNISTLVTGIEGKFYKKAKDLTRFTCREGLLVAEMMEEVLDSSEPKTMRLLSSGYGKNDELIAEFWITWSVKSRGKTNTGDERISVAKNTK